MSYWGKFIGGMAGFAMGGPVGALFGMAMGHAADQGKFTGFAPFKGLPFDRDHLAAMLGQREAVFATGVTTLAAKLAKCDGPVSRIEIQAFRSSFSIPEANIAQVGRVFDHARDSVESFEIYATQLGQVFSDERGILEQVLGGLYQIARADGPVNATEQDFLNRTARCFGLDDAGTRRASGGSVAQAPVEDSYLVLGIKRTATAEEIRIRWKQLVREHHPDVLSSQGASPARIKLASDKVAKINAAYDAIKRDRRL